jgi:AcrR family transcriptional regulator
VVLEALVALIDERSPHPTIPDVAARAGLSVRTVYHHFGGIRELLVAAVALQSDRHRDLLFLIPPRGSADLRITALCRQRRLYFEEVSPVYRMALVRARGEPALHVLLADDRAALRAQLARTLAPELSARRTGQAELLDALAHATGWDAWQSLRDDGDRTAPSAERVMALTATSLLS